MHPFLALSALLATSPLLSQLRSDPECYIHPGIEIEKSSNGDGFGCFIQEPVEENELLFSIPTTSCISIIDALVDEECGEKFNEIIERAGDGGRTVVIAGYLAKEYLKLEHLGRDKYEGSNSAYLQTLPFQLGKNEQDHVIWWTERDIEDLLVGSLAYRDTIGLREEVDLAVKVLGPIIGPPVKKSRQGILPWGGTTEGVDDAIRGAFVTLLTRSFLDSDEGNGRENLVPLLDMLQHTSGTPNVKHERSSDTVDVRARAAMEGGTELLNSYSYSLEPWTFFTRYGFVPDKGAPRDLLKAKDIVFFDPSKEPKSAEV